MTKSERSVYILQLEFDNARMKAKHEERMAAHAMNELRINQALDLIQVWSACNMMLLCVRK